MDLNDNIRNNIQRLRRERSITQDVLAAALEISVQAISKWETGASLPDIMQLPRIAKFFGVTIDYLFYSEGVEASIVSGELPDDNILRIIQFKGNKMLGMDLWEKDKSINLKLVDILPDYVIDKELNVEIWGNANIMGNISGYVDCGGTINCGNIEAYAECGGGINCGHISGYVECGGGVNCGNVDSYIECGGSVNCGNVNGYVDCGGNLTGGDIMSQVECGGNLSCKEIHGNVECEGDIIYVK